MNNMDLQSDGNTLLNTNGSYGIYTLPLVLDSNSSPGAVAFTINSIRPSNANVIISTRRPYPKEDVTQKLLWTMPLKYLSFFALLTCIAVNTKSCFKNVIRRFRSCCSHAQPVEEYEFPIELTGNHRNRHVVLNIDEPFNLPVIRRDAPRVWDIIPRSNTWPVCTRTFLQRLQDHEDEPLPYII